MAVLLIVPAEPQGFARTIGACRWAIAGQLPREVDQRGRREGTQTRKVAECRARELIARAIPLSDWASGSAIPVAIPTGGIGGIGRRMARRDSPAVADALFVGRPRPGT